MKKLEMYELRAVEAGLGKGFEFKNLFVNLIKGRIALDFDSFDLVFDFIPDPFRPTATVFWPEGSQTKQYVIGTLTGFLKAWKEFLPTVWKFF